MNKKKNKEKASPPDKVGQKFNRIATARNDQRLDDLFRIAERPRFPLPDCSPGRPSLVTVPGYLLKRFSDAELPTDASPDTIQNQFAPRQTLANLAPIRDNVDEPYLNDDDDYDYPVDSLLSNRSKDKRNANKSGGRANLDQNDVTGRRALRDIEGSRDFNRSACLGIYQEADCDNYSSHQMSPNIVRNTILESVVIRESHHLQTSPVTRNPNHTECKQLLTESARHEYTTIIPKSDGVCSTPRSMGVVQRPKTNQVKRGAMRHAIYRPNVTYINLPDGIATEDGSHADQGSLGYQRPSSFLGQDGSLSDLNLQSDEQSDDTVTRPTRPVPVQPQTYVYPQCGQEAAPNRIVDEAQAVMCFSSGSSANITVMNCKCCKKTKAEQEQDHAEQERDHGDPSLNTIVVEQAGTSAAAGCGGRVPGC